MPRPRRPDQTVMSPDTLEQGEIGLSLAHFDNYFNHTHPQALEVIFAHAVNRLPEPERSCVIMVAMQGITYREAAEYLAGELGRQVHRKTAWRWTQRGLRQLRRELEERSWSQVLLEDRLPKEDDDA